MQVLITLSALLYCAHSVFAWGADTHPAIGHIAEAFLSDQTKSALAPLIEPQYDGSIGEAANWADQIRRQRHATEGWHFIDANDNPPDSCSVSYPDRDCGEKGGCVVGALRDQSATLSQCLSNSDTSTECVEALKFVIHFMGDITQPLHCSAWERGGNEIEVKFGNRRRNFHSCWDTYIPDKIVDALDPPTFDTWVQELVGRIQSQPDSFITPPTEWVKCIKPENLEKCAVTWAKESNKFTCSFVYHDYQDSDLAGNYLQGATPIVETQVAKAGLRLGVFLNYLVTGQPGWGSGSGHDEL